MKRILSLFLATLFVSQAMAQSLKVTGKISEAGGTALPGVTVLVKGTNTGTASDTEGSYALEAPANSTLVFSFIGYATQEIVIGNKTTVNVEMAMDAKQLGEVVITAFGIERE